MQWHGRMDMEKSFVSSAERMDDDGDDDNVTLMVCDKQNRYGLIPPTKCEPRKIKNAAAAVINSMISKKTNIIHFYN